jgi:hypothetical protein
VEVLGPNEWLVLAVRNGECKGHSQRLVEEHTLLRYLLTKRTKCIDGWVAVLVLDLMRDMLLKQQPSCLLRRVEERWSEQMQARNATAQQCCARDLNWQRLHAPTSRGVPAIQRLRMHDGEVGISQSRGGLNTAMIWYEPANPAES